MTPDVRRPLWLGLGWTARVAVSLLGALVGFALGGMTSMTLWGLVVAVPLALGGGLLVLRWTRPWVGRTHARFPTGWFVQWTFEAAAALGVAAVAAALMRDPRIETRAAVAQGIAVGALALPLGARLGRVPSLWTSRVAAAVMISIAGVVSYDIGGLAHFLPALVMAGAAGVELLDRQRKKPDTGPTEISAEVVRGDVRPASLVVAKIGIGLHVVMVVGIALARVGFVPMTLDAFAGVLGFAFAYGMGAIVAAWALPGRPRLLNAAAVVAVVHGVGWPLMILLYDYRPDLGPPAVIPVLPVVPAVFYAVAANRLRRVRGPGTARLVHPAAVLVAFPPMVALSWMRDWGCARNGCTDDFVSLPESLAALILTGAGLGVIWLLSRRRVND